MLRILLENGGLMAWLLLGLSAVVIVVFIERLLHYHRAQINSGEFLNGVRNVLKRDNVVEALSICVATPGPVVPIPTYAGYNYLVNRVNSIVLDMEKASTEILNIVADTTNPNSQ